MSKKKSKTGAVVGIRLPEDMQEKVRAISAKSRLAEADVMRMALDRGLSAVEKLFAAPTEKAA